jgi:hypothetical protein
VSIHYATIAQAVTQTITAVAAAGAAVVAAWIAHKAWHTSENTAKATEAQAKATEDSAQAAADAARAADASARVADTLAQIEINRRHEEMYPQIDATFDWERVTQTVPFNVFAKVTNQAPRDCQMDAATVADGGGITNEGNFALGAGQTATVYVGKTKAQLPVTLVLGFDAVDACPCPKRTQSGRHWQRVSAIPQEGPVFPVTAPAARKPQRF